MIDDLEWKAWLKNFRFTQYTLDSGENCANSQVPDAVIRAIFNLQFAIPYKKCYDCKYYKYLKSKKGYCKRKQDYTGEHNRYCVSFQEDKDKVKWEKKMYPDRRDKFNTVVFPAYYPWKVHWNSPAEYDELKEWVDILYYDGLYKNTYVISPGDILVALILSNELKQPWYKLTSVGREICHYLDNVEYWC